MQSGRDECIQTFECSHHFHQQHLNVKKKFVSRLANESTVINFFCLSTISTTLYLTHLSILTTLYLNRSLYFDYPLSQSIFLSRLPFISHFSLFWLPSISHVSLFQIPIYLEHLSISDNSLFQIPSFSNQVSTILVYPDLQYGRLGCDAIRRMPGHCRRWIYIIIRKKSWKHLTKSIINLFLIQSRYLFYLYHMAYWTTKKMLAKSNENFCQ